MRVIFTHHARQRMRQRRISEAEVFETLGAPDDILPGDEHEDIAVRKFGAREILVVYEETGQGTVVIYTVMRRRI